MNIPVRECVAYDGDLAGKEILKKKARKVINRRNDWSYSTWFLPMAGSKDAMEII